MKKRILSVLMTILLVFSSFGFALTAVADYSAYDLRVNDTHYTEANISELPKGVSFNGDAVNPVITLENFSGSCISFNAAGTKLLQVVLKGENTLTGGLITPALYSALANLSQSMMSISGEEGSSLNLTVKSDVVDKGSTAVWLIHSPLNIFILDNVTLKGDIRINCKNPETFITRQMYFFSAMVAVAGDNDKVDLRYECAYTASNFAVANGDIYLGGNAYCNLEVVTASKAGTNPIKNKIAFMDPFTGNFYASVPGVAPGYWQGKSFYYNYKTQATSFDLGEHYAYIASEKDADPSVRTIPRGIISVPQPYLDSDDPAKQVFADSYENNWFYAKIDWTKIGSGESVNGQKPEVGSAYQAVMTICPKPGYRISAKEIDLFDFHFDSADDYTTENGVFTVTFPAVGENPPAITKQPQTAEMINGNPVTLTVEAQNADGYEWLEGWDGGTKGCGDGEDYSGTRTNELTIQSLINADERDYDFFGWYCVVYAFGYSPQMSKKVRISYRYTQPTIVSQPESVICGRGDEVDFTVEAKEVASYQWQVSYNGGETWKNCSDWHHANPTTKTLTVFMESDDLERTLFRCVLTDKDGGTVTTDSVFGCRAPVIRTQPSNVMGGIGNTVEFKTYVSVNAMNVSTYKGLTYQWQMTVDGGKEWFDLKDAKGSVSGAKTDTVQITLTKNEVPIVYYENVMFRCVATNRGFAQVITNPVRIYRSTAPVIKTQPTDSTTIVTKDMAVWGYYSVGASVEADFAESYQWYTVDQDGNETKLTNVFEGDGVWVVGATGPNLGLVLNDVNIGLLKNGMKVFCVVTNIKGDTRTETVTLSIQKMKEPVITGQPISATVSVGDSIEFSVKADGDGLTYQWQMSEDNGATWKDMADGEKIQGAKTDKLKLTVDKVASVLLRVVVSNGGGEAISDVVVCKGVSEHVHSYTMQSDKDGHRKVCSCGDVIEEAAHTASDWIVDAPAEVGKAGSQHKECTVCGYVMETAEIPALEKPTDPTDPTDPTKPTDPVDPTDPTPTFKKGDINGDGKVSAVDARMALRCSAKLQTLTEEQMKAADVNGDGKVTAVDARLILRVSAKLQEFD